MDNDDDDDDPGGGSGDDDIKRMLKIFLIFFGRNSSIISDHLNEEQSYLAMGSSMMKSPKGLAFHLQNHTRYFVRVDIDILYFSSASFCQNVCPLE